MEKKIGGYILKTAKPEEIPDRGKWKALALEFIDALDQTPERHLKIENIKTKKEYDSLYDALLSVKRKNKLTIEIKRENMKIFLLKDFRYFVR